MLGFEGLNPVRLEQGIKSGALPQFAELVAAVQIPSLAAYGVEPSALPDLVARARRASSMAGNPLELTDEELFEILERAL